MKKVIFILAIGTLFFMVACEKANMNSGAISTNPSGKAGSLARFAIVGNYLYAIDQSDLSIFDITNPSTLIFKKKLNVGESIETIFPFRDKLFIASNSGMYMYNITDPLLPVKESFVQHITGCDPVVANATHAYLTIRSGRLCGSNNLNVLEVYKLGTNIATPTFVTRINMQNPVGLGLHGNYLFVADKMQGLVVFDITNGDSPLQKQVIQGETFIDVIVNNNILICMLTDGIAYYDISDMQNITKLSTLK
jgi:hypothetical protein